MLNPELVTKTLENNMKFIGTALLTQPGLVNRVSSFTALTELRDMRDRKIWNMPILPGAVTVYQQLASHREWQVTGKPNIALRAVEALNETRTISPASGMMYIGFEEYLERRALDFICIGRTSFLFRSNASKKTKYLEYVDPTWLTWVKPDRKVVKDSDKVWQYFDDNEGNVETFKFNEIFLGHPLPIGAMDAFISPLLYVMPTAMLAWLLREHNTASLDGRKIRDIIFVGNAQLQDAVEDAIKKMVALHAGEDPSKIGIPLVAVNNISGAPLKDQVFTLGLSKIPETFNEASFKFDYVNQISAALGLSLRHFWSQEDNTNRALEEIQEQRQQQKGPVVFTRTEERIINRSPFLEQFGTGTRKPHFAFIEEVDSASQKTNAEVLKLTTDALASVANVFKASLSLEAMLSWMQSIRVLPNDLELITMDGSNENPSRTSTVAPADPPTQDVSTVEDSQDSTPPQSTSEADPPQQEVKSIPDYGEVSVDNYGRIREKRVRIFSMTESVKKVILNEVRSALSDLDYDSQLLKVQSETRRQLQKIHVTRQTDLYNFVQSQKIYNASRLWDVVEKAMGNGELNEAEETLVSYLVQNLDSANE